MKDYIHQLNYHYLILFDESDECGSFNLDGLAGTVVDGDYEVEEVGFTQVARRLLLEVSSSHAQSKTINQPNILLIQSYSFPAVDATPRLGLTLSFNLDDVPIDQLDSNRPSVIHLFDRPYTRLETRHQSRSFNLDLGLLRPVNRSSSVADMKMTTFSYVSTRPNPAAWKRPRELTKLGLRRWNGFLDSSQTLCGLTWT